MWEKFIQSCKDSNVKPLRMRIDVPTRWNSAYTMMARAIYLQPAIERFVRDNRGNSKVDPTELSGAEWELVEMLTSILLPFKTTSQQLQCTSRPGIDQVFWVYETLFNKIDKLTSTIKKAIGKKKPWAKALQGAIEEMGSKLSKYYEKTGLPFVYSDSVILDPFCKLLLFEQASFREANGHMKWKETYTKGCRQRFVEQYQRDERSDSHHSNGKRKRDDNDEFQNDYHIALTKAHNKRGRPIEYDNYLNNYVALPLEDDKRDVLGWWRINGPNYPALAMMFRNTHAVSATGAGVEREFSKSGRIVRADRNRLNPETVTQSMMYKNMLTRHSQGLKCVETDSDDEEVDGITEEEIRRAKQLWTTVTRENGDEENSDDDVELLDVGEISYY
jgi:hypothetical protein